MKWYHYTYHINEELNNELNVSSSDRTILKQTVKSRYYIINGMKINSY